MRHLTLVAASVLGVAASAEAQTEIAPIAEQPLLFPNTTSSRIYGTVSAGSALFVNAIAAQVGGAAAIDNLEMFADIAALAGMVAAIEGEGEGGAMLGSLRVGGRYVRSWGPLSIAPAAWAWIPSPGDRLELDGGDVVRWSGFDGLGDARSFLSTPAVAVTADVAVNAPDRGARLELGAALVSDGGPQIDNVFTELELSTRRSGSRTTWGLGYRLEVFPREHDREPLILHMPGVGMSRRVAGLTWKARLHPMFISGGGLVFSLDLARRLR